MARIYTRSGDLGQTRLADGQALGKNAPIIAAIGELDELNSQLGVLLSLKLPPRAAAQLQHVQHLLFDLGGQLAQSGQVRLAADACTQLEGWIDAWQAALPPLRAFILPGGNRAGASAHLARAVCRRTERALVGLGAYAQDAADGVRYLNRLSDYLFVLARALNDSAQPEWQKNHICDAVADS